MGKNARPLLLLTGAALGGALGTFFVVAVTVALGRSFGGWDGPPKGDELDRGFRAVGTAVVLLFGGAAGSVAGTLGGLWYTERSLRADEESDEETDEEAAEPQFDAEPRP